jgi:ATP-dependent Lhr-like helicase
MTKGLEKFHPAVASWFSKKFEAPTEAQARAWESILAGEHTLVAAPTGSGKTLAAFLSAIDGLVRQGLEGSLQDTTYVVYVSPLKALSNDIQLNLQEPLAGIKQELTEMGLGENFQIRTFVRTGDTAASERATMVRRPPHIIVTTPESLFILLTSESGRRMLRTTRSIIVDEIHAMVQDKRGSHLSLSIERLEALTDGPLVRIGLSATQRPIEEVARFLVGTRNIDADNSPRCQIIDTGHVRELDLALELPPSPLEAVLSNEVWEEIYDRLAVLISEHRTTIVFVNTRRLAERVARHLSDRIGEEFVTSHHGSLSRDQRLGAERRLKSGELRALVATASLELGIDIGAVDLVCQLGSTRSIATLLQRIGRSGHTVGGQPKGRIFPMTRDELIDCAALMHAIGRGELDRLVIPEKPLDILAQQIVAELGAAEWSEDGLYELCVRSYPFRQLERNEFNETIGMLVSGFSTRRGRRSAYVYRDAVNHRLRGRRGARLAAVTSGGAIPDTSDYRVILEPGDITIGTINEDFAVESLAGDIFQLGNYSYRIRRVETGSVRVEDAHGQPPSIPFWLGEAPGRTKELSHAVSRLRTEISELISKEGPEAAMEWLKETGLGEAAAEQIVDYLKVTLESLGAMPSENTIVVERFFDEGGGTEIVIHSLFGSHLNRAWGLALRKRFCRKFNFELQAAATENSILFSFGPTHSFPLDSVFDLLKSQTAREILIQALLDSPMFTVRWRWNSTRSLAVLRWRSGHKVAPQLQRMMAEDLLALIFPEQLACAENLSGDVEVPDHPLVRQTVRDCLEEAMDVEGFLNLLKSIERGEIGLVVRESRQPSPLAQEVLTARPYAYLDDAPLEERRAQAVQSRRLLTPESAEDLGRLDQSAIDRVAEEAWPEANSPDELHDALLQIGSLTEEEGKGPLEADVYLRDLIEQRRATVMHHQGRRFWIAAERLIQLRAIYGQDMEIVPPISPPEEMAQEQWSAEDALVELVRGRLEHTGPQTARALATLYGLAIDLVQVALSRLEAEGFILEGKFSHEAGEIEWCARHILARIHQYTLSRLRREIEPVSSADFMRFLLEWQRVEVEDKGEGPDSLLAVIEQLEGFEAAASSWESDILPARITDYDPAWLDLLCQAGRVIWARISRPKQLEGRPGVATVRQTPITFLKRDNLPSWAGYLEPTSDASQFTTNTETVYQYMVTHGASFFADIVRGTSLLPSMVQESIGELVAAGVATSDSFIGIRTLLVRANTNRDEAKRRKRSSQFFGMENAGRWSIVSVAGVEPEGPSSTEMYARKLMARYGVVFRRLLERENTSPPWRELLRVYRRLEARGEVRGGRFIAGFSGEQFALAEAVSRLRAIRRRDPDGRLTSVGGADPLNLIGITLPGGRVAQHASNRILYRDGIPVAVLEAKQVRYLVEMEPAEAWQARAALLRRQVPPQLRPYLRDVATVEEIAKAG